MELHCSQTSSALFKRLASLRPLWNYTALKPNAKEREGAQQFETPMELHCSQTSRLSELGRDKFETPMELHCSQTSLHGFTKSRLFETPMELHCSQTTLLRRRLPPKFETPMELHCSQTTTLATGRNTGLRPLWNYTALKHVVAFALLFYRLRPLWNYTALKPKDKIFDIAFV